MNSIWRANPLLKATNLPIRPVSRTAIQTPLSRFYSQSTYGDGHQNPSTNESGSTRSKEHPGPPSPNVSQSQTQSSNQTHNSDQDSPEAEASSKQPYSTTTSEAPNDNTTRDVHQMERIPSNKAHPTMTTGQQSPNVDLEGHRREDIPEEVKRHNEEIEKRHDRSFNQITDEGKIQRGFPK